MATTQLVVIVHAGDETLPVALAHGTRTDCEHAHPVKGEDEQPRYVMAAARRRRALSARSRTAQRAATPLVDERLRSTVDEGAVDVHLHAAMATSEWELVMAFLVFSALRVQRDETRRSRPRLPAKNEEDDIMTMVN